MLKEHFFHKITLLFTARLGKNWNIGGALRVAPVCSTPNTSLLSNLAVYNAERSELHQGNGEMVSGGRGRVSATHGRMAVGARTVTRDWSRGDQDPGSPPSSSSIWSHSTLLHLRLADQDQMWATQHNSTVKHQGSRKISTKTIEMSVRYNVISNNCWFFPHKKRNKKFKEKY